MADIRARAAQRFASLRSRDGADLEGGDWPTGWCVSTIARIVSNDRHLVGPLQELQGRLADVGEAFLYPEDSLHVSLLGCTQREDAPQTGQPDRLARIVDACRRVTKDAGPVALDLGAVNRIGGQFFVEVYTDESTWGDLRRRLALELAALGESPLTHPDPEPMHLNLARLQGTPDRGRVEGFMALDGNRIDASLTVTTIEVVVTDFVVTPETTTVVDLIDLGAAL
jgi:hypothetical protein